MQLEGFCRWSSNPTGPRKIPVSQKDNVISSNCSRGGVGRVFRGFILLYNTYRIPENGQRHLENWVEERKLSQDRFFLSLTKKFFCVKHCKLFLQTSPIPCKNRSSVTHSKDCILSLCPLSPTPTSPGPGSPSHSRHWYLRDAPKGDRD